MNNVLQFPLLAPVRERAPATYEDLMKMPFTRLVDATLGRDKVETAKAIAAFHARLPDCTLGWEELTEAQQTRWTQLVQLSA